MSGGAQSKRPSLDGLEILRELSLFLAELRGPEEITAGAARILRGRGGGAVRLWLARFDPRCPDCPDPDACSRQLACLTLVGAAGPRLDEEPECLPFGRGLAGLVAASRNELLVPRLRGLGDEAAEKLAGRSGLEAFCGYPLRAAGRFLGVLGFQLETIPATSDQRMLTTCANILAQALGAAFIRREQARHARDLEEKVEAKTAELKARVSDLEEARLGMLNMMSDALDAQRRLKLLTEKLESRVEERTRELLEAKEEAERANAMKSRFLGRVSHELRTPLHGIISFARLGIQKIDRSGREKNLGYFQQILESAGELVPLIDDLLDIARIEAGKLDYDFQPLDLRALVADIAAKQAALLGEKGLRLEVAASEDFPAELVADRKHLRQLLVNLLGNAAKFSPPGGLIEVKLERVGEDAIVAVADRGPGIPEDELAAVFEPFAQGSRTREKIEGAGLGLAIARAVALDHGGSIGCSNREGGGSIFRVVLPVRAPVTI